MATSTPNTGLTIIPCNKIQSESTRLSMLFNNCHVLTDKDMKDLVNLIYSTSLCNNSGSFVQDNIITTILPNVVTVTNRSFNITDVLAAINATPAFTIGETKIALYKVRITENISSQGAIPKMAYYLMVNTGAGTYGQGHTQLTSNNLFWLRTETGTIVGGSEPVTVYDIVVIDENNLDNPHIPLNANAGTFPILSGNDYYFRFTYYVNTGNVTPYYKLYRFVGSDGNYGIGGGSTAVLSDFLLVEEEGPGNILQKLTLRNIVIARVLSATETIADAVNASQWSVINIGLNELVSFEVQRQSIYSDTLMFSTEKYFWKKGYGTIDGDSTVDDFLMYDVINRGSYTIVGASAPTVVSLLGTPTQPHTAVNASSNTYVIDGTSDYYFSIYYPGVGTTTGAQYRLYRFTGANGTYGNGGSSTSIGDFTLIFDQTTPKTTVDSLEAGPNITIDFTNPFRPKITATALTTTMESYNESGTRAGGDLLVKVGDYDGSSNGTYIEIDDSTGYITAPGLTIALIGAAGTRVLITKEYLVSLLSGKADDITVVHLSGTETISGSKTFTLVPKSSQDASGGTDLVRKSQMDTALSSKANDSAVVHIANTETISGQKTFSLVPKSSQDASTGNDLTRKSQIDTLLLSKADDSVVVKTTGTQTIAGAKTFSTVPKSSQDASASTDLVRKSQHDLKANDNAVVKLTGNQTVAGVKTFSVAPKSSVNAVASDELVRLGQVASIASTGIIPLIIFSLNQCYPMPTESLSRWIYNGPSGGEFCFLPTVSDVGKEIIFTNVTSNTVAISVSSAGVFNVINTGIEAPITTIPVKGWIRVRVMDNSGTAYFLILEKGLIS